MLENFARFIFSNTGMYVLIATSFLMVIIVTIITIISIIAHNKMMIINKRYKGWYEKKHRLKQEWLDHLTTNWQDFKDE